MTDHTPLPAITFAIPYYTGPEYLARAVRSVFEQDTPGWRLVVCDDGPDGSGERVLSAFSDPRVRYVRNPRTLGMAANWNRGLDLADTDLVTLLHADDELLPGYAGLMARSAAAHPDAAALFCQARVIGPDGRPAFSFPDWVKGFIAPPSGGPTRVAGPTGIAGLLRGNYVMCPTVCYRKSRIGGRRFEGRWRFVLDLDFFTRLLRDGGEMVGLTEVGYAYRRHPGNATTAYTENLLRFEEEAALYDELAADAAARGWDRVERVGRRKRIIRLHLGYRILSDVLRGRVRAATAKLNFLRRLGRRPLTPGLKPTGCRHA